MHPGLKDFSENACVEGDLLTSKSLPAAGQVADWERRAKGGDQRRDGGFSLWRSKVAGECGSDWVRTRAHAFGESDNISRFIAVVCLV